MASEQERWVPAVGADDPPGVLEPQALDLAERFQRGDPEAFAALSRPLLDALYTLCLRVVGNEEEAEDIAQEALIRALRNHRRFDPARSFRPWLLHIALNLCRDHLRTVWWSRVLPLGQARPGLDLGPELRVMAADRDARVRRALATLPRKYREAVALFHLEDLGYAEMAAITGAKIPALKQRVRRGLAMLEEAVKRLYPELLEDRRSDVPGDGP